MSRGPTHTPDDPLDPSVLGELLEATAPETPPPGLRARVLAGVRAAAPFTTVRSDASGWTSLAPGIDFKMLVFDPVGGTKSFLLRAAPGTSMPGHGHGSYEECLVLEGEFRMGDLTLRAGDFHGAAAGALHPEARTDTGVLVYLRAGINDYPGIAP